MSELIQACNEYLAAVAAVAAAGTHYTRNTDTLLIVQVFKDCTVVYFARSQLSRDVVLATLAQAKHHFTVSCTYNPPLSGFEWSFC